MPKRRNTIIHFVMIQCLFTTIASGCYCNNALPPFLQAEGNGRIGLYRFDGQDAVRDFNYKAKKWFMDRGFSVTEEVKFKDLCSHEWDMPGVLLVSKNDPQKIAYIFIPDCFCPEENSQSIGYHVEFEGSAERVTGSQAYFYNVIRDGFITDFPPTEIVGEE